jgi:ABC-2 type transport system ATP-binding protein
VLLDVEDLTVDVAGHRVVDHVGLDVGEGEIVAVIGPNGAGKTSLLEALVGLRPSSGTVRVAGVAISTWKARARAFAFAPDDAILPPEVLVRTLTAHAGECRPRAEAVCTELARGLALGPLLARSPGTLSRGEAKRVALYLALSAERPLVVLDEPFGAFDPLQLGDVLEVVRSVARAGAGVLVSVHQLADAERIAGRVLLLAGGRRVAFGSLAALREEAGLDASASLEQVFLRRLRARGERAQEEAGRAT